MVTESWAVQQQPSTQPVIATHSHTHKTRHKTPGFFPAGLSPPKSVGLKRDPPASWIYFYPRKHLRRGTAETPRGMDSGMPRGQRRIWVWMPKHKCVSYACCVLSTFWLSEGACVTFAIEDDEIATPWTRMFVTSTIIRPVSENKDSWIQHTSYVARIFVITLYFSEIIAIFIGCIQSARL